MMKTTEFFVSCSAQLKMVESDINYIFVQQMGNEKNPSCLGYIGDYTTQLSADYNKPL